MTLAPLARRAAAEFLGTGLLVTVVVGSGIMATRLTTDVGIQMLANSIATALGLSVLILMFGTISGAHFNPAVSLVDWFLGRRRRVGLTGPMLGIYTLAQIAGAIGGAVLANVMFDVPTSLSTTARATPATLIAEVVATFGLVLLIVALARTGRGAAAAPAVGAYIGAAYWFTSSTSFANPAVTIGRLFSDMKLPCSTRELNQCIAVLDTNANGEIELIEFYRLWSISRDDSGSDESRQ